MCDGYRDSAACGYDHLLSLLLSTCYRSLVIAKGLYSKDNDSKAISVPQYRTRRSAIVSSIKDFVFINVLYCVAKVKCIQ